MQCSDYGDGLPPVGALSARHTSPRCFCLQPTPTAPAEHDPLDMTAGYPYPGRPQISSGDNVSCSAATRPGSLQRLWAVAWLAPPAVCK